MVKGCSLPTLGDGDGRLGKADRATPEQSPQAVSALRGGIADAVRLFPFTLRAYETPHFTESPREFREVFQQERPRGRSYYAYDVEVRSATQIEFTVYGMRDNLCGGIGPEVGRFVANVSRTVTAPAIEREIQRHARQWREAELEEAERVIVGGYAAELRAAARGMSARRAKTPKAVEGEARQPGADRHAPTSSSVTPCTPTESPNHD